MPGLEVAGVVRSAPSGSGFRPRDRVGALAFSGGSTAEKAEAARQAGATDVVPAVDRPAGVAGLLGPRAIDVVVDPVATGSTDSLRALASGGRLLVLGFTAGEIRGCGSTAS